MCDIPTKFRIIMLLAALILLPTVSAFAEGNLDPAFGVKGVAFTDFGIADDEAQALAVQPDGKVLLAGFSSNSVLKDIAVARYQQDGKLDTTFHTTGYTTFNIGNGNAMARAVAVQEDGGIIIAGTSDNGANEASSEIFLVRLTDDGFQDDSFGTEGKLVLPLQNKPGVAYDLQFTADGDILVAGTVGASTGMQAMIARVDQQGNLVSAFGEKGIVFIARDYDTAAHSLVLLDDDSILLAGYSKPAEVAGLSLFRLKADGAVDESFGKKGEVQVAVQDGEAVVYDMAAQADGRLVVVGSYDNGKYREVLLGRFLANGQTDASFGTAGMVRNDLGHDSVGYGVAVQEDGAILATGFTEMGNGKDIILLRYGAEETATQDETTESPATASAESFSNALTTDQTQASPESGTSTAATAVKAATATYVADAVSAYDDEGRALAVMADGRVLAAGYAGNGNDNDFVLLQYSPAAVSTLADSAGSAAGEVSSLFYGISTISITNVTRNSAMSGGVITRKGFDTADCQDSCQNQCEDDAVCLTDCLEDCTVPTVTARGVAFGTAPHPVFRPVVEDTTDTTDDETDSILPPISRENSFNYETVLSGQTSDGSGVGSFGSHIVKITPDTTYYVRAYAVLSDETVIYGNELAFETRDACFIATAAYGSMLDPHVVVLRNFRDSYLKGTRLGQAFIDRYYRFSPVIAEFIDHNEVLKQVVRLCLWPWVAFCYLMLQFAGLMKFALSLLAVLFAGLAAYFLRTNKYLRKTV